MRGQIDISTFMDVNGYQEVDMTPALDKLVMASAPQNASDFASAGEDCT